MLFEATAEEWARATHTEPSCRVRPGRCTTCRWAQCASATLLSHENRVGAGLKFATVLRAVDVEVDPDLLGLRSPVPLRKRGSLDTVADIVPAP